jgi:hypothetical protein
MILLLLIHRILTAELLFGEREYYGGHCEMRLIELEIGGVWYETRPIRCETPRS